MKKTYTLTMSEAQARLVIRALDIFTRIGIGQFEEVLAVYDRALNLDYQKRERLRISLNSAKAEAGHPANGSYGIHNPEVNDDFRAAFDIQQVIRNRLAFDQKPEGGIGVDFDEPRQISKLLLPTIKSE
jgi:hypothetical protein